MRTNVIHLHMLAPHHYPPTHICTTPLVFILTRHPTCLHSCTCSIGANNSSERLERPNDLMTLIRLEILQLQTLQKPHPSPPVQPLVIWVGAGHSWQNQDKGNGTVCDRVRFTRQVKLFQLEQKFTEISIIGMDILISARP